MLSALRPTKELAGEAWFFIASRTLLPLYGLGLAGDVLPVHDREGDPAEANAPAPGQRCDVPFTLSPALLAAPPIFKHLFNIRS